jgi:hypothetical protein
MARTAMRKGTCSQCGASLGGTPATIGKHLLGCEATRRKCPDASSTLQEMTYYRIYVRDRFTPDYWMMLDVRAEDTLTKLDKFLRDIWLECCGHLSEFRIRGEHYESLSAGSRETWETPAASMRVRIEDVLVPGAAAEYTYDYGSSTELMLRVVSERTGQRRTQSVVVLARNEAPTWTCETCGEKRAIAICPECAYDRLGMLCATCMKTHPCGEDMLMPIVNSPRMGVCGYTGDTGDEMMWQIELDTAFKPSEPDDASASGASGTDEACDPDESDEACDPDESDEACDPDESDEAYDPDESDEAFVPEDSDDLDTIHKLAPSSQGKAIGFPGKNKSIQEMSQNPNIEEAFMETMRSMFPEVSQEQVEGLIDKLRNMSPEEKETFSKFGSRLLEIYGFHSPKPMISFP